MVFAGKQKLLPRRSDLSFFNWKCQSLSSQASPSFEVRLPPTDCLGIPHWQSRVDSYLGAILCGQGAWGHLCKLQAALQTTTTQSSH